MSAFSGTATKDLAGMIELDKVSKRFQSIAASRRPHTAVDAVRDVTLSIPAGSVRAVAGPNGAGKSTLFALILGFLHPTGGRIRIDGMEPRRYLRRRGAGYLPERFRLPGEWAVRDALVALARLEGLDSSRAKAAASRMIERFQLEAHAAKPLRTLSRGLLQRVGVAQLLLADHELVVFDEPTEGLDPLWRIRFRSVVDELRAEGRTVLMASHDLGEVERLVDEVILMEGGRIKEVLDTAPAFDAPTEYQVELAEPSAALAEAFPGAEANGLTYHVSVTDAHELSTRLAALLAGGATIVAVRPATQPLEERVQRALRAGGHS